jgi:hypothetical protein
MSEGGAFRRAANDVYELSLFSGQLVLHWGPLSPKKSPCRKLAAASDVSRAKISYAVGCPRSHKRIPSRDEHLSMH